MMFDGGAKPFSVVYFDGKTETNLGILMVDPTMNIKTLLSILSQRIGISPHKFSVFIADQNSDRKIPFTAKVNISAVARDGGAFYFYVKRSGRSKKALVKKKNKNLSEKKMLLRRDGGFRQEFPVDALVFERGEMERRMWKLKIEREAFLRSMGNKVESLRLELPVVNGGGSGGGFGGGSGGGFCKDCLMAEVTKTEADFHLCVRDEVIVGFRTSAGPIFRPVRNSGQNGH